MNESISLKGETTHTTQSKSSDASCIYVLCVGRNSLKVKLKPVISIYIYIYIYIFIYLLYLHDFDDIVQYRSVSGP